MKCRLTFPDGQRSRRALVAALAQVPSAAVAAAPLALAVPVDCEIGKACVLQAYVDHDSGTGAQDYRCGVLTYNGHKGTDIRVIDAARFKAGVAVFAAAPGRVRAIRDGMDDVSVRVIGKEKIAGREAGNSVVIAHGGDWETQYAHLRKSSVAVRPGDVVERGQLLGLVGLSGNTEFRHLHFEVRYAGKSVDPFVGRGTGEACAARAEPRSEPLWQSEALSALAYVPSGLLDAGISGAPPAATDGAINPDTTERFASSATAAVFWVQIYGAQAGDIEALQLIAPDGRVVGERRARIPRNAAQWLAYIGKRRGEEGWAPGIYRGEYALYRGAREDKIISVTKEFTLDAQPTR